MWPNGYYWIKEKSVSGALEALKNSRNKKKGGEKEKLKKEIERERIFKERRVRELLSGNKKN